MGLEPAEVRTAVFSVRTHGDKKAENAAILFGDAKVVRDLVQVTQAAAVRGEDTGACLVIECQHGIQVVLAHVADGKGHSLLR
jgi:hypothetical protein